jgi:hypothetical protein
MKCAFLKTESPCCAVNNGVYAPSAYERDEYCTKNRHKLCPLYCSVRKDGKFRFTREMRLQGADFCRSGG